ncbi:MAG: membrane integrity-associated transporter subunit PqiC [Acidobacteriaceae bacterium]|nr:membrane integrity-associated transporter subunit PqiC [Acidobacteriaceae bacterium]
MSHAKLVGFVYVIGFIGAVVGLAGCGGKVRYPSYYVLNVPPPAPQPAPPKPITGSAAVREFSAPRFLRAGPIVYRQSPEQLGFYNYDRWAVDPRSTVTTAFLATLQSRGVFQSVHLFDARSSSDYLVTGTLDHLEEVDQGKQVFINVAVSAQLSDLKAGSVIWSDTSSETAKLENRAMPGLVAGMSRATNQAITQLVSSMQNRLLQLQSSASSGIGELRPE